MEAKAKNTLIEDILVIRANLSKQSTHFLCLNPLAVKCALYFSMNPFHFNFFFKNPFTID